MATEDRLKIRLTSVDKVARSEPLEPLVAQWGFGNVVDAVRAIQTDQRNRDRSGHTEISMQEYSIRAKRWLESSRSHGMRPVFNLTGTILHSNLGRASLDEALVARSTNAATRPVTLEYDTKTGARGNREHSIRERLCRLTGAESATVVNNNAAAVLLVLNTLAMQREVVVSRGELIEIGDSFRLPDIMSRSGCRLREVGTTNRTRIEDFSDAINENTGLLLKVHPSNYEIHGFTESASERELASLSASTKIPFVVDLGSGALIDLQMASLPREPLPHDSLKNGAALVTFSGDKLMGGPQAGLIVGQSKYIEQVNANPLKRALRLDKLTLALLDETLKAYEDPATLHHNIKLVRELTVAQKQLKHRASSVESVLRESCEQFSIEVIEAESVLGSGSQPGTRIPTIAVALGHSRDSELQSLDAQLRELEPAVIGRRSKSRLLLDMRGAEPLEELLDTLRQLQ